MLNVYPILTLNQYIYKFKIFDNILYKHFMLITFYERIRQKAIFSYNNSNNKRLQINRSTKNVINILIHVLI